MWRKIIITTRVINRSKTKTPKKNPSIPVGDCSTANQISMLLKQYKAVYVYTFGIAVGECQILFAHNEYLLFKFWRVASVHILIWFVEFYNWSIHSVLHTILAKKNYHPASSFDSFKQDKNQIMLVLSFFSSAFAVNLHYIVHPN